MPVQPPKQTSGSGFTFEEKVVAWYGVLMLCGVPPFREELGCIQQITLQARVDGWLLDDLVLTLRRGEMAHRAALSVKSKTYFGVATAAPEFVRDAWEQLLGVSGATFQEDGDFLGVVTTPLPPQLRVDLEFLRHLSATSPCERVEARVQEEGFASQARRTLYQSFGGPSSLSPDGDRTAARLLARSLFEEFDFDREDSRDEATAITHCQSLLVSGGRQEAQSLWEAVANELRRARGVAPTITLSGLTGALRERFRLSGWPAHQRDWQRLDEFSRVGQNHTSAKIGDVRLAMEDRRQALRQAMATHRQVAIVGPSGLGKSAAVKEFSQQEPSVLWVEAADLEQPWAGYQDALGLDHSLPELLSHGRSPLLLVIDGLDRSYDKQAFQNAAYLLELVRESHPQSRVVLTSISEEWFRINRLLRQGAGHWHALRFAPAELTDLAPLAASVPAAEGLLLQRHLAPVLRNLKIVDLIVSRLRAGGGPAPLFVGETTVADWYWQGEVNQGPDVLRGELVKQVASLQAERFITRVPVTLIAPAYLAETRALVRDRVLHSSEERLWFGHDLLGDWARLRQLLGLPDDQRLTFIAERADNPFWHRAIQLYAMRLLEQGHLDAWRQQHSTVRQKKVLCGDLFLDALFLTAQPLDHLTALLAQLTADGGALIRHLFERFFVLTTLPHPEVQRVVTALEPARAASFAASHRIPELYRWVPLIQFAVTHLATLMPLVPAPLTRLARDFLLAAPAEFPGRPEAARLALEGARAAERSRGGDEHRTDAYQAAFLAIPDLPGEAKALLRALAGRAPALPNDEVDAWEEEGVPPELRPAGRRSYVPMRPARSPWPDGPEHSIDDAFRAAVIDPHALLPVMARDPQLARELLLATLIESTEERPDDSWSLREEPVEIERQMDWWPAWWYVGPVHSLFQVSEPEALEFVLRLVNFATQRWSEQRGTPPSFAVQVGSGSRTLPGDSGVYFWHRGHCDGHNAPAHALTVALSSLEKYMYEQIDQERDLSELINQLMERGASAAFIGLLCTTARYRPGLLKQPSLLRCLLTPEITLLESHRGDIEPRVFPPPVGAGARMVEAYRAWQHMAHRRRPWLEILQELFVTSAESRPQLQATVQGWPDPGGDTGRANLRRYLLAVFDEQRYSVTVNEAGQESWTFKPPEEFQPAEEPSVQVDPLFAWTCRQMLSGEKPVPEAQALWQTLMDYASVLLDRRGKASFLLPGVNLLMQRHGAWVHADPQRLAWCRQTTLDAIQEGVPTSWEPSDLMQTHWYTFSAPVLARLLVDRPADQEVRSAVTTLVACGDRIAVELLLQEFQECARQPLHLDADFGRLRHLVMSVGVARDMLERCARRSRTEDREDEIREDAIDAAVAQIQIICEAFVEGTLSRRRPALHSLALRAQQLAQALTPHHPHALPVRLSAGAVLPAFSYLLAPTVALTPAEVGPAADELYELLGGLLPPAQRRRSRGSGQAQYERPTPDELRILRAAGRYGVLTEADGDARKFWSPLLALGDAGREWITPFLEAFVEQMLALPDAPPRVIRRWLALIGDICTQPVHAAEVHKALMGLTSRGPWQPRHTGLVTEMRAGFASWADRSLHTPEAHAAFARFLVRPEAEPLRVDGLCWLALASQNQSRYWWESVAQSSTDLLQSLWDSNPDQVFRIHLSCFRQILSALESHRFPQAILLSKALAAGPPD